MTLRRLLFVILGLAGVVALRAQDVHWDPAADSLAFNRTSQMVLVFENCEPDLQKLKLPDVPGLAFGRPSSSTNASTMIMNGTVSETRTFSLTYPVRASKKGSIAIPEFSAPTDKGTLTVKSFTVNVADAPAGRGGVALEDITTTTLETPRTSYWAGEVIPVTYTFSVVKRYFNSRASKINWDPAPFVAEEWSEPQLSESVVQGERRAVVTHTTRAYSKQPGSYTLKPATMLVNMVVGYVGFGFFTQQQIETLQATTKPIDITIKPLPAAPSAFSGAIGTFTLNSKVVPTTPAVGEPITWTLELSGVGNWPDITGLPEREVSKDFQVIQPKSKRTMKDGSLFEGTLSEDVVLVPSRAGSYTLGAVKMVYFDPQSGEYRTLTTEPVTVTVGAAAQAGTNPASTGPVQFSLGPATPKPTAPQAVAPSVPENLPRDMIPGEKHGWVPFTSRGVVILCLIAAVACPLVFWIVFAMIRSRETDPRRRRREALANLGRVLGELRKNPNEAASLLREWQSEAAQLWEIRHAAPDSHLVHAVVAARAKDASSPWAALWSEADRTLHGPGSPLPADWVQRAQAALQHAHVPEWSPATLFLGRNLFPFVTALLVVLSTLHLRGEDGAEAYARADFPAAESAWRTQIHADPANWSARHNLGLALAQQDRWAEASAHFAGAFLMAPRSDATRWDLALGLQKAGMAPPGLVELGRGHGRFAIARWASPGEWQVALVAASLLIAAALVVLLFRGYRRIGPWARPTALSTILAAIVVAALATVALRAYGELANPRAALVWKATALRSIPTEADSTQKMSPLSAGSVALADREFLGGWTHLTFPGGQAGWVRTDDLVRLYR
ncbi:MAG TPA: BatD family protein [Candidatus Didemnitutus sp.]|nr:BatD family protein [Candidatus Didemnitutus sp.]